VSDGYERRPLGGANGGANSTAASRAEKLIEVCLARGRTYGIHVSFDETGHPIIADVLGTPEERRRWLAHEKRQLADANRYSPRIAERARRLLAAMEEK
jgi:hypothetical protein